MVTVESRLASVSWDFRQAKTSRGPHGIHPYPAKFIPQIPQALIDLFHPGDGSAVLDPFCGSGTTLVEAATLGLPAVGIDLHPLATLIAKVKTTPLHTSLSAAAESVSQAAKRRVEDGDCAIPDIPRLDHWFRRDIQAALAALVASLDSVTDADTRDALKVAFSSIIVRVSNQDSDTRYAAIEKDVSQEDVWTFFARAATRIEEALADVGGDLFRGEPRVQIVNKDLMKVTLDDIGEPIGLVITSPPYPNAYEYWLYHKYRMYWLSMDPIAVREAEIGARPHYFKKNHQTEHDFQNQMQTCFGLLASAMLPGAYACFVIGRSIIHGRRIDNEALLERAAAPFGFTKVGSVQREIAAHRKSFNLTHGKIKGEGIVIFQLGNP